MFFAITKVPSMVMAPESPWHGDEVIALGPSNGGVQHAADGIHVCSGYSMYSKNTYINRYILIDR